MDDRIADVWGPRTPYAPATDDGAGSGCWPARVDQYLMSGITTKDVDRWVQTASVLHSNGDAYDFAVRDGSIVGVRGRAEDRVNRGRLGPKDLFGWQANNSADRLERPLIRAGRRLVETDWATAMGSITDRAQALLAEPGGWGRIGFYTSGQLALEDYYTLGVIGKAGIGTPHMDGNTRLCTATAATALKVSFGTDGQPGSYADVDYCDAIALWGHNVAETQTVLWARMLDRRAGAAPPRLLAVDPRPTPVAREADVHLAPRNGTNLALMNAFLRELIARGWYDERVRRAPIPSASTNCSGWSPATRFERVAQICDVSVPRSRCRGGAGRHIGAPAVDGACRASTSRTRRPRQRARQQHPSAARHDRAARRRRVADERSADRPEQSRGRRRRGPSRIPQLGEHRACSRAGPAVERRRAHDPALGSADPCDADLPLRRARARSSCCGSSATNPAVSMPDLARIRKILADDDLYVVVQDIFLTETAELADVVLPAATWGERTGTFTNADRTVHLSDRAVDPPGEARSDLDIFLDFARRMDFRNLDGEPLIWWDDPESAFEAWKDVFARAPLRLQRDDLRAAAAGSASNGRAPTSTRMAPSGCTSMDAFNTDPDFCETYGYDIATGAPRTPTEYRALEPQGRAFLYGVEFEPGPETTDDEYPTLLTTGQNGVPVPHSHQDRARSAAGCRRPRRLGRDLGATTRPPSAISEGDLVRVESARGYVETRARITDIRPGVVFVPFHYGTWRSEHDTSPADRPRAANELTLSAWDPVSKQPIFKVAAVKISKVAAGDGSPRRRRRSAPPHRSTVPRCRRPPAATQHSSNR